MTDFVFDWDANKAAANIRKHGIAFDDAVLVFADPLRQTVQDRIEGDEYRWQTTGVVYGLIVLLVAHFDLEDGETTHVRIISARKATPKERKRYEQQDRDLHV